MSVQRTCCLRTAPVRLISTAARRAALTLLTAVVLTSPGRADDTGRGIAEAGSGGGAPACSSCHGQRGEGQPESGFPRLSGLDRAYLARQLDSFADGSRKNEIMAPIATALTPEERSAVAAFYAGLPAAKTPTKTSSELMSSGERLARMGDWATGVPPCISCHGPAGAGVGSAFPALAGQNAVYIANQLNAWRAGRRANDPMGLMATVAKRLSDGQIEAVAAYFGGLDLMRQGATP